MILKNLLQSLRLNNRNLLPEYMHTDDYPYLGTYFENANELDFKYLGVNYGTLPTVSDLISDIDMLVKATIKTNDYKYRKILAVNSAEYNPIWNVDGKETETHEIAQRKTTSDMGEREVTNDYGDSSFTTVNSEVPNDTTTEKEIGSTSTTRDAYEDSTTANAYQDVVTEDGYTDTITKERGGNIGVTMTQQLIEAERKIADYDLTHVILVDIINAITYPTFEEV